MAASGDFFNLYRHNFIRVAVATPLVRIADCAYNAAQTIALMREAVKAKAVVAVFPELGLTAYSAEDLFHQQTVIRGAESALADAQARLRAPVSAAIPPAVPAVLRAVWAADAAMLQGYLDAQPAAGTPLLGRLYAALGRECGVVMRALQNHGIYIYIYQ